MPEHLWASGLKQGQPVPARRREGADRTWRDLDRQAALPAAPGEVLHRLLEIRNPVDEDGPVALNMVGQEQVRRACREFEHRHACAHPLDRKHQPRPEDVDEIGGIGGNVAAGRVDVLELFEEGFADRPEGSLAAAAFDAPRRVRLLEEVMP